MNFGLQNWKIESCKDEGYMKLNVENGFPYGLNQYDESEISKIGLKIIHIIETTKIKYNSSELNELLNNIKNECADSHIWVLYGSNDKENWIPLQAASRSSENVVSEIRTDFLCMTPFDEARDSKNWDSYFYNSVMQIRYGSDAKCQKYQKMKNMCNYLAIAILISEESLDEDEKVKDRIISKYQKKECDIALKIKPLFWNPAGKEFTYIKSIDSSLQI